MVIVTRNQYIAAQKIHHITLDEELETINLQNGQDLLQRKYVISIVYTSEPQSQNSREENRECMVTVIKRKEAYLLFKDLCKQIREQSPDSLYLSKILENFLTDEEIEQIGKSDDEEQYKEEMKEMLYDPRAKAVRGIRKAKRKRKSILRKAKSSAKRRR